MNDKTIVLFLSLFLTNSIDCQSLRGEWVSEKVKAYSVVKTDWEKISVMDQNGNLVSGLINYNYGPHGFEVVKFHGSVNWMDSTLILIEDVIVESNYTSSKSNLLLGIIELTLKKFGASFYLAGTWRRKDRFPTNQYVEVLYKKTDDSASSFDKSSQIAFANRTSDVVQSIRLGHNELDSVKFSLYDNGEIDNDSVSVYLDDSVLVKAAKLTSQPIEFYYSFQATTMPKKLKFVAENLGNIPPNTALLIIKTRFKRHQISLASDFSKNACVEFLLE